MVKHQAHSVYTPTISVILPFYNAEKTIKRALESISNQTYANFECIVVNNNSTDAGHKIASEYCAKDSRFMLLQESKQGVVFAFNKGLEQARGQFIARMDADDWSYPERLAYQISWFENNPDIDVVAGMATYQAHKPETGGFQRYVSWSNQIKSHHEISLKIFIESPIINPTVMWRITTSNKYGSYADGEFPEDYELWLRWMSKGAKFHKLDIPVVKWYDSDNRLTRTDQRYSDEAFFKIKTVYLAKWLKLNNPFYPEVVIWGASKISRKRAALLISREIQITAFIDITQKRQVERKIIYYQDMPSPKDIFVLVYLKEETMRSQTIQFLHKRGFREEENYLLVS
jgi:glycosyltransferase involved in cell wall biosynthesis